MSLADQLQAMASGLCRDADLRVSVGDRSWSWEPSTRTLHVPAADVETSGARACAGLVAHEVGHAWLSRYLEFRDLGLRRFDRLLLNVLEDARVESWMQARYPGVAPWLDQALEGWDPAQRSFPALDVLFTLLAEGRAFGRSRPVPLPAGLGPDLGPEARAAVEATRAARRAYVLDFLPPVSLAEPPAAALAQHQAEVAPVLRSPEPWPPERWECLVRVLARRALLLAVRDILPAFGALYQADLARASAHLRGGSSLAAGRRALAEGFPAILALVAGWFAGPPPEADPEPDLERRELARSLLECLLGFREERAPREVVRARRGGCGAEHGFPGISSEGGAAHEGLPDVSGQVNRLVRAVEAALPPRRRVRAKAGFHSGHRISLSRAMSFEADPRRPTDLWERRTRPVRARAAFLLMVDLSGSMVGEKVRHALAAATLFSEALGRLEIPFSVVGFQDRCIPALGFEDRFGPGSRRVLASLAEEATGTRPGGHGQPRWNDDGPCLLEAAQALLARPEQDRFLVVLSDGRPAGRRSSAEDLHRAVRELRGRLHLVGLGVGPQTEHVAEFYPRALVSVPLAQLAERVGGLLREALVGAPGADRASPTGSQPHG